MKQCKFKNGKIMFFWLEFQVKFGQGMHQRPPNDFLFSEPPSPTMSRDFMCGGLVVTHRWRGSGKKGGKSEKIEEFGLVKV